MKSSRYIIAFAILYLITGVQCDIDEGISGEDVVPSRWWDTLTRRLVADVDGDENVIGKWGRRYFPLSGRSTTTTTTKSPILICTDTAGWQCVPYYRCSGYEEPEGRVVSTGSLDTECPLHLEVCCMAGDILGEESIISARLGLTSPGDDKVSCGQRNDAGVSVRIDNAGLSDTQFGEFPWMVAVLRYETLAVGTINKELSLYVCGGSLISKTMALTAAHCVEAYNAHTLKVRVGEWDTQQVNELFPHREVKVSKVSIHPDFIKSSLHNDIAILHLESPVDIGPHIDTICIPSAQVAQSLDYNNCYATGWGKDKFDGSFQNILKKVKLDVVDKETCQAALRQTRLGAYFLLDHSFICAGGRHGIDTCKGDGGAPLVCPDNNGIYFQVGIVAWGIGCGEDGIPGVYVDVTEFYEWLDLIQFESYTGVDLNDLKLE